MRRLTIRLRLTALYGVMFLLAGTVLLGVTYLLVERNLAGRPGVIGTGGPGTAQLAPDRAVVRLPDGRMVDAAQILEEVRADQQRFRADTLRAVLTQGSIALAGVAVVAGAFGWLLSARALAPVHRITDTARRIATGAAGRGLHERISLDGPRDELRELADTFDAMLDRLDRSFDSQRRFVANASHELRTPLAVNRALVELAMTRPDASADVRRLGESLLAVNGRQERLMDGLLTLADSENELTDRSPVDLPEVAAHVLDTAIPAGTEVIRELDPAPTAGDAVLLERLVHNLVENAVRHNVTEGGWVSVQTGTQDGRAMITVANTGPAVRAYEVPVLFEPFRRVGADRAGPGGQRGFGLGLSIVRAIARAHGGEVTAEPRAGGGLTVTVSLPIRAASA
jgi:signal transduction histidine kinase